MTSPGERLSLPHLSRLLKTTWTIARRAALCAVLVAGALILLEGIHLHRLLAEIHPALAWAVSGALGALLLGFLGYAAWRWWRVPRVILPPDLPQPEGGWTPRQTAAYLRFCRRYLERQARNPALDAGARAEIPALVERLTRAANGRPAAEIVKEVETAIDATLEPLDRLARREVWAAATQIAVLTAVNPSALLDVLITLLRNVELMARIAEVYYSRPGIVGTLRVVRDVMAVAATAGVVERIADSLSDMTAEVMGSWSARLAGPVGQGLTNGLLTLRLGDATVVRCRSLRSRRVAIKPWSSAMWREMARRLAAAVSEQVAPELARGFRAVNDRAGLGAARRFFRWLSGLFASDEAPSGEA